MEREYHRCKGGMGGMIMKKAVIPLVLGLLFSAFGHGQPLIYSWRDSSGKVHIVDELNKVPIQYREDLTIYRLSSRKEAKKSRPEVPSKLVTKEEEVEEGTVKGEWVEKEMEEVRSSITDRRNRLEALRQERETKRIRMIRKRAQGKAWIRERREIEEIDREIETLTNEMGKKMEALRSLEEGQSLRGGE
jgi:hypothetical protein